MQHSRVILSLYLLLGMATVLHGETPSAPASRATPLPRGAVARLGTPRSLDSEGRALRTPLSKKSAARQLGKPFNHYAPVNAIAFTKDAQRILSSASVGDTDVTMGWPDPRRLVPDQRCGEVFLWETATGRRIGGMEFYRTEDEPIDYGPACLIAPDCKHLIGTHASRETVARVETTSDKPVQELEFGSPVELSSLAAAFTPEGRIAALVGWQKGGAAIYTCELSTGKILSRIGCTIPKALALSADGSRLAMTVHHHCGRMLMSFSFDWKLDVEVYDPRMGRLIGVFNASDQVIDGDGRLARPADEGVAPREMNGEERTHHDDPQLTKRAQKWISWESLRAAESLRFRECLALNPEGTILAVGLPEGTVSIRHAENGKPIRVLLAEKDWIPNALLVSPDNKTLAIGKYYPKGHASKIQLVELASGHPRTEFRSDAGEITVLAFSRDGNLLASADSDTTVLVWKVPVQNAAR